MKSSLLMSSYAIFKKDLLSFRRSYLAAMIMLMFSCSSLFLIFFSLNGERVPSDLKVVLFWVIVFLASTVSLNELFQVEALSLTLPLLKIYAEVQAIFLGKFFFASFLLCVLMIFLLPIFFLFAAEVPRDMPLFLLTVLGSVLGLALVSTLISYMCTELSVARGGLLHILIFPLVVPILLPAISLSRAAFLGEVYDMSFLIGLYTYDSTIFLISSILFDYLLEE